METRLDPQEDVKIVSVPEADGKVTARGTIFFRAKGKQFTTALHPAIVTHVIGMGTIADHNSHERRVRLRTS